MIDFLVSNFAFLLIAISVSIAITLIIEIRSRDRFKIEELAKRIIVERLEKRESVSLDMLLQMVDIPNNHLENGKIIIESIGGIIGISPEKLRLEDKLEAILRVNKNEVGIDCQSKWEKTISTDDLVFYIDDIFTFFEKNIDDANWPELYLHSNLKPQNEGEWLDIIGAMSIKELILTWGPALGVE
jgi:hypothetical protein